MTDEQVDLRKLRISSPEELMTVPLDALFLQDAHNIAFNMANIAESLTVWHVFPFESFQRATLLLKKKLPHIFVTHWHIGLEHTLDNEVTKLVLRLKEQRGEPSIGRGPFIVGTANWSGDRPELLPFLRETYDYIEENPFCLFEFIKTLSRELFYRLPHRNKGTENI